MSLTIRIIPRKEFARVREADIPEYEKLGLIATMCRANALAAVKRAGSGHLGSSFSAMDIVVWLYYHEMNTLEVGLDDPNRDIYFSSKGHDVPGLYAVLHSAGVLDDEKLMQLRRFGGLDGHPDVGVTGVEANSGSLGMGISKGRGIAWAKRRRGLGGRVFVMTGDGELQEGQNYEALMNGAMQRMGNLRVIVDNNKVQSDKRVSEIVDLGDLEGKFRAFGWNVARCDGHDLEAIDRILRSFDRHDGPSILIADTIKGRGVSFMEHPVALEMGKGLYPWHAGAPDDDTFGRAHEELLEKVRTFYDQFELGDPQLATIETEDRIVGRRESLAGEPVSEAAEAKVTEEFVSRVYGEALLEVGGPREDVVVLDGDLSADCKIRGFETTHPDRFIENGIAEQDMVSMAGGLARHGFIPVVNTFANFLAARANEQIYNNASEKSKIIYANHYSGLIPAGPGKSHQSVRDISLFSTVPNCEILQPSNGDETRMIVKYAIEDASGNVMIRLVIGPSPRRIDLPAGYSLQQGRGSVMREGDDAMILAYGPVMLHEVLTASEMLASRGIAASVINMPWLNRLDREWFAELVERQSEIFVVEDHAPVGGLGEFLLHEMMDAKLIASRRIRILGVEGFPACGTPSQALEFHGLDGRSIAVRVSEAISSREAGVGS